MQKGDRGDLVALNCVNLGLNDHQSAARLDDLACGTQIITFGRGEQVYFHLRRQDFAVFRHQGQGGITGGAVSDGKCQARMPKAVLLGGARQDRGGDDDMAGFHRGQFSPERLHHSLRVETFLNPVAHEVNVASAHVAVNSQSQLLKGTLRNCYMRKAVNLPEQTLQDVIAKWRSTITNRVTLVILTTAIVLTTLSGPFGTFAVMELPLRLVFWSVPLITALLLGTFVHFLFQTRMPAEKSTEADVFGSLFFAIVFGGLMFGWVSAFSSVFLSTAPPVSWLTILLEVAVITLALLAIRTIVVRGLVNMAKEELVEETVSAEVVPLSVSFEPRLMRRLSDEQKSPILWLTSEDHFVEVHTKKGCVRIRMRLMDAIDEMEGVEGSCVHRSHWVAYDAINSAEKVSGYWRLHLSNGETVPVSRKYQPLLEEAGILERLAIA